MLAPKERQVIRQGSKVHVFIITLNYARVAPSLPSLSPSTNKTKQTNNKKSFKVKIVCQIPSKSGPL